MRNTMRIALPLGAALGLLMAAPAFAAVVRAKSFTRAAARIGVTQSALSQTVRSLERRLDLKLLNRTTRSVAATEAGEQLFRIVEPRLAEIESELAMLGNMRGRPVGTIRITASEHAVRAVVWPRLLPWLPRYPEIRIEHFSLRIMSSNRRWSARVISNR